MSSAEAEAFIRRLREQAAAARGKEPPPIAERRATANATYASLSPLPADVTARSEIIGDVPAEWLFPPGARDDRVILYLHGGSYTMGSIATHRAAASRIGRVCGATVLVIDYRLAPEDPFPAARVDAMSTYEALLRGGRRPDEIVIAGDSAGGGLAISALRSLRDRGSVLPAAAVVMSPWVDLTLSGASLEQNAQRDPQLTRERLDAAAALYASGTHRADPGISPLFAPLHGLPPVLVQAGGDELLLSDAERLADRLVTADGTVSLEVEDGLFHAYPLFGWLPEAQRAVQQIGLFLEKHAGWDSSAADCER